MENKRDIPLDRVLSARGTLIVGGETYRAYCIFLEGRREEARDLLIREHFSTYFGERRNITSDKIVTEIYEARGILKPADYMASDPEIVREAVIRRVDGYLTQLEELQRHRYVETDVIRMSSLGADYIMRSCGENKIAALAALGYEFIRGVILQ